MIIADTNILANFLLPYEFSRQAQALYERDPEWAMPALWWGEFRNLLAGYLRRRALTFEDVVRIDAEGLLSGNEYEVESRKVLELVRDSDCSACDCEFVALGIRLGVKVITMDKNLLSAFPQHAQPLVAAQFSV